LSFAKLGCFSPLIDATAQGVASTQTIGRPRFRSNRFFAAGGLAHSYKAGLAHGFDAYAPSFTGGVHVAAGDLNGDGHADIVTAPIQGPTHVRAFDGLTGADLASFLAFSGFNGGTNVAVGDVDGDGRADIITGAGPGAAPHVKVFSGATLSELRSFLAFAPSFTGGVVVGALDANGDGRADLVVTPQQGPAHVRLLDGLTLGELDSFFAFHPALNGGAAMS